MPDRHNGAVVQLPEGWCILGGTSVEPSGRAPRPFGHGQPRVTNDVLRVGKKERQASGNDGAGRCIGWTKSHRPGHTSQCNLLSLDIRNSGAASAKTLGRPAGGVA